MSHRVLIADASRAVIYKSDPMLEELEHVDTLEHPEGRLHEHDLVSDVGGRGGHGTKVAKGTKKGTAETAFAREICDTLERGHDNGAYEELVLVAPPHFLGELRGVLSSRVRGKVSVSLDRDYMHLKRTELGPAIRNRLR